MKKILIMAVAATSLIGAPMAYADNHDWRDPDRHAQWNPGNHNGYYYRNRWHYGAPPQSYVGRPDLQYGWHSWRRGDRLPRDFRTRYVVVDDWRSHRLPPPRRGYHWMRDDKGDFILAAIATGLIASVVANSR